MRFPGTLLVRRTSDATLAGTSLIATRPALWTGLVGGRKYGVTDFQDMHMPKHHNHPIVNSIVEGLRQLNLPYISWSGDILVASRNGECQANIKMNNVCIAIHFNFDLMDKDYEEHLQIVAVESCIKGYGTRLVSVVMDCVPEDMKVCVYDSTEGEAKAFWPKMAAKYPNIVCR